MWIGNCFSLKLASAKLSSWSWISSRAGTGVWGGGQIGRVPCRPGVCWEMQTPHDSWVQDRGLEPGRCSGQNVQWERWYLEQSSNLQAIESKCVSFQKYLLRASHCPWGDIGAPRKGEGSNPPYLQVFLCLSSLSLPHL